MNLKNFCCVFLLLFCCCVSVDEKKMDRNSRVTKIRITPVWCIRELGFTRLCLMICPCYIIIIFRKNNLKSTYHHFFFMSYGRGERDDEEEIYLYISMNKKDMY